MLSYGSQCPLGSGAGEEEEGRRRRRGEEEQQSLIKSNNPRLAGGEKLHLRTSD